jgi:hypothetical protein
VNFSRPEALLAISLICLLAFSGCLSVDPSVSTTSNERVFENFAVDEPWASNQVWVNTTLSSTPAAANVTTITVIQENGRHFSTQEVAAGQTSIYLALPPNQNATLVATNSENSTTIQKMNVRISSTKLL